MSINDINFYVHNYYACACHGACVYAYLWYAHVYVLWAQE